MTPTLRLGRWAGVPVGMNLSALILVGLLTVLLAVGSFPALVPGRPPGAYLVAAVATALVFVACILVHELAHAVVARRYGVTVERIVLWLLGGVAQLRGQLRTPGAEFAVAVVGPLTSLALGVVFGAAAFGLDAAGAGGLPVAAMTYLAGINVILAVFNLIPAAPLDGGRVLRAAVWRLTGDRVRSAVVASRAGRVVGTALIVLGVAQLLFLGGLGGVWLALVGWFLVHAATAEEQAVVLGARLHGVPVRQAMSAEPVTVPPDLTVAHFVDAYALNYRFSTYPLVDDFGRLTGLVTLNRIRAVPPGRRAATSLADIACPPEEVPVAGPDEPLEELLNRMGDCTDGRAVVVSAGRVVGLVTPSDISRALVAADLAAQDPYPPRGADLHTVAARGGAPR